MKRGLIIVILMALAGCITARKNRPPATSPAEKAFYRAEDAFDAKEFTEAIARYSRLKRRVLSSFASLFRCPSSWITSILRSNTSVCYLVRTTMPLVLRPARDFLTLPDAALLARLL